MEIEGTGIWIQAQIEDLTSRFNLNTLVKWQGPPDNLFVTNPEQVQVFRKLLESLKIDPNYADLLVDWIDTDIAPQATQGGEDTLYLTQAPPYRPPNTFIVHPSEILALPGFGPERYAIASALHNGAAHRREDQSLHRQRPGARRHHERPAERTGIPAPGHAEPAQEGLLSRRARSTPAESAIPTSRRWRRPASTRNPRGSGCAPTFALAPRSSFCTVFYSASRTIAYVPCNAALAASDR